MIEKKSFTGGANKDADDQYIAKNQYRDLKNFRVLISDDGETGSGSFIRGNVQKLGSSLPSGDNTVIAAEEDKQYRRLFYFIYNSNGDHLIRCYDLDKDQVFDVLKQETFRMDRQTNVGLNFKEEPITGTGISGFQLFWTDHNGARRINVERGIKTYSPSYTRKDHGGMGLDTNSQVIETYLPLFDPNDFPDLDLPPFSGLQDEMISVIRRAPQSRLFARPVNDASLNGNNIADNAYFFSYRYVYEDGEISPFAPWSQLVNYNIETEASYNNFNAIDVGTHLGLELFEDIRKVEFAYKHPEDQYFNIFKTFSRDSYDGTSNAESFLMGKVTNGFERLSHRFTGSERTYKSTLERSSKEYDAVPITSKALEVADNRLFLGNNVDLYDNPKEISVSKSLVTVGNDPSSGTIVDIAQVYSIVLGYSANPLISDTYQVIIIAPNQYSQKYGPKYQGAFIIKNLLPSPPSYSDASFDIGDISRVGDTLSDGIDFWISETIFDTLISSSLDFNLGDITRDINVTPGESVDNESIFNSLSPYQGGIAFFDKYGRTTGVLTDDTWQFSTPTRGLTTSKNSNIAKVVYDISDVSVPDWAYSYQLFMSKNLSKSFFIQSLFPVDYYKKDSNGNYVTATVSDVSFIGIDISSLPERGFGYTFVKGDRINISGEYVTEALDQSGDILICNLIEPFSNITPGSDVLCEIYTPRQDVDDEDLVFYQASPRERVFNGEFLNESITIYGDSYMIQYGSAPYYYESMNPSKKNFQKWFALGKPLTVGNNVERRQLTNEIKFGGRKIQGTNVNAISEFSALDSQLIPESLGDVSKLQLASKTQELGTIMLAICKNDTASIYLGENQLATTDGDQILSSQQGVLGRVNVLRGGYGCQHPESVVEQDGNVYWLDAINGSYVQYSRAGLTPVSEANMRGYFKDLSDGLLPDAKVYSGYDVFNDEVLVTFPQTGDYTYFQNENLIFTQDFDDSNGGGTFTLSPEIEEGKKYRIKTVNNQLQADYIEFNISVAGNQYVASPTYQYPSEFAGPVDDYFIADGDYDSITVSYQHPVAFTIDFTVEIYEVEEGFNQTSTTPANTWSYLPKERVWGTNYSFIPEMYGKVTDNLITFKDGELYVHNISSNYNEFYGVSYDAVIDILFNSNPSMVKVPKSIIIEGNTRPYEVDFKVEGSYSTDGFTTSYTDYTQETDLVDYDFKWREGNLHAAILRDRNTPNGLTSPENLYKGDELRGKYIRCILKFNENRDANIKFVNLEYVQSFGHEI